MTRMKLRSIIDDKKKARVRGAIEKDDPSMLWPKKGKGNEPIILPITRRENVSPNELAHANSRLFKGAMIGNPEMIRSALAEGADIETMGAHGETVLTQACLHNRRGAAGVLIYAGANLDAKDNTGGTALMAAAANGYKEIVLMLVDAGADVNLQDNSGTRALGFAKMNGYTEIARFLRQNGAKE